MKTSKRLEVLKFIGSVCVQHVLTYFVLGFLASLILDYRQIFQQEVIRDYYLPFGSLGLTLGPFLQVLRGLLFALVLLPFRNFLRGEVLGWLWLWLLFLGIGILGPPSAAPSSLEGLVFTRIPLWFHALGLPKIVLQTLAFSLLVHRSLRKEDGQEKKSALPSRVIQALVVACLSLLAYSLVSVAFALALGVPVESGAANLAVLGQFLAPLLFTFLIQLIGNPRRILIEHGMLYVASVLALLLYQALILGGFSWVYVSLAPLLPVLVSLLLKSRNQGPRAIQRKNGTEP